MAQAAKSLFNETPEPAPMKSLFLAWLRANNFKGLKNFRLDLDGCSMDIYGDNGLCKTTIEDAFTWLLTGKDSLGRQDFGIKPLENSEPVHNLEMEVEAGFSVDGRSLVFRRVLSEDWTKKRGQPKAELTGHSTAYYVDGVPKSQRDYEAKIAAVIPIDLFCLLSDPRYFSERLEWKDRRRIVLEVCGDVSDRDVIAMDPRLAELTEILSGRSLDDQLAVLKAAKTKVNKDLEQVPVRISEVRRGLPDVSGLDAGRAREDLALLQAQRQAKADEFARAQNGAAVADKQIRLSQISSRMTAIESECRMKAERAVYDLKSKLQDARFKAQDAQRDIERYSSDAASKQEQAAGLQGRLEELYQQYDQVDAEEFTYPDEMACPTCGQSLPEEMLDQARQKALESFNVSKSDRLEKVRTEGKGVKNQKERLESEAVRSKNEVTLAQKRLNEATTLVTRTQAELDKAQASSGSADAVANPEHRKLAAERDTLTQQIEDLSHGGQADTSEIEAEISALDEEIRRVQSCIARLDQRSSGEQRISELEGQEKTLSAEFERLEKQLFLCEEFMKAKVRLLDDKIAPHFRFARFRMFEAQVNGGLNPCCEALGKDGVPYSKGLNNSAKINVGLDIIRTLSEHFGFRVPIFVDNAEAVTRLTPVETQVVRLVVSESDKVLRFEKEVK